MIPMHPDPMIILRRRRKTRKTRRTKRRRRGERRMAGMCEGRVGLLNLNLFVHRAATTLRALLYLPISFGVYL